MVHLEINIFFKCTLSEQNSKILVVFTSSQVIVGAIIGVVDFIMLFSDWYSERLEKKIKEAKVEGHLIGAAKYYAVVKNWNDRRIEAENKGEDFDEPMPTPRNIQEATPVKQTNIDHAVDERGK